MEKRHIIKTRTTRYCYKKGRVSYHLSVKLNMAQEYNTRCLFPYFASFCLTLDVSSINSKEIETYIHIILYIKDEKI